MEIQKNFFILLYYATGRDTKQLCSREHLGLVGTHDGFLTNNAILDLIISYLDEIDVCRFVYTSTIKQLDPIEWQKYDGDDRCCMMILHRAVNCDY